MNRKIVLYPNPLLKQKSATVEVGVTPGLAQIAEDLTDTLRATKSGCGIAAIQIGEPVRMVVIDPDREVDPLVLLNPVVRELHGEVVPLDEGCLSFPGVFEKVKRNTHCVVDAIGLNGEPVVVDTRTDEIAEKYGKNIVTVTLLAHALQHEIEHLDGVLFIDKLGYTARERAKRKLAAGRK